MSPPPRWRALALAASLAGLALLAVTASDRLGADFWPPDRSFVGPNLVAAAIQAALVGAVVVVIWPPARRRIHAFLDQKLDRLHAKLDEHRQRADEHHEWMARHTAAIYERHLGEPPEQHPHFDVGRDRTHQ